MNPKFKLANSKQVLLQNTFMLYLLTFSNYFLSLVVVPYETRILGPTVYGTLGAATAIMVYFQLVIDDEQKLGQGCGGENPADLSPIVPASGDLLGSGGCVDGPGCQCHRVSGCLGLDSGAPQPKIRHPFHRSKLVRSHPESEAILYLLLFSHCHHCLFRLKHI